MRSKIIALMIFTDLRGHLSAQTVEQVPSEKINPSLLDHRWKAQWISHPSESLLDYGVFHFRKSFEIKEQPKEFIINISADNRYRLFVNGKAVCFGPARADLEHWSFESIDIAAFLKPGKNLLAAEVWNFGELKPWAQFSIKTAFIVQGNSPSEEIVNTDTFMESNKRCWPIHRLLQVRRKQAGNLRCSRALRQGRCIKISLGMGNFRL